MINIIVEDNVLSQSFVNFARTLPYVTVEDTMPKKRTMAEAIAQCGGHTVDEFIGELNRQLDEYYENA